MGTGAAATATAAGTAKVVPNRAADPAIAATTDEDDGFSPPRLSTDGTSCQVDMGIATPSHATPQFVSGFGQAAADSDPTASQCSIVHDDDPDHRPTPTPMQVPTPSVNFGGAVADGDADELQASSTHVAPL